MNGQTRNNVIGKCGLDIFATDNQTIDSLLPVLVERMSDVLARMESVFEPEKTP